MQYKQIFCKEKKIQGLTAAVTGDQLARASAIIGRLWDKYFQTIRSAEPAAFSSPCYGVYMDYQTDGGYTVLVGNEELKDQPTEITLPAGNYAVFSVHGDVKESVAKAWEKINALPLRRRFLYDYEVYLGGSDPQHMDIQIYVGIQ